MNCDNMTKQAVEQQSENGGEVCILKGTNLYGKELRWANRRTDVWPGYHVTCPLGKRGYWFGDEMYHIYLGMGISPQEMEFYEIQAVE